MMYRYLPIRDIYAREILDSGGNPALEAEVLIEEETIGRAAVPSGSLADKISGYKAKGSADKAAVQLWDKETRYLGRGVERAVGNGNEQVAQAVIGWNVFDQTGLDRLLAKTDGSKDKRNLGANTLLGVSMAAANAAAQALHMPLYRYLGGTNAGELPIPVMSALEGGAHNNNALDIQEIMLVPGRSKNFRERLRICTEIYHIVKDILRENKLSAETGESGGFIPDLPDVKEALKLVKEAAERTDYVWGTDIFIALDIGAQGLYREDRRMYEFPGESRMKGQHILRGAREMTEYCEELLGEFPICFIQDPLGADDWKGWDHLMEELGEQHTIAGGTLFSSNVRQIERGILSGTANAAVIRLHEAGTLSEIFHAIKTAKSAGYKVMLSHSPGETENTLIADIAVAFHAEYIRAGAPAGMERIAKYNRLLRIEEEAGA